MLNSSNLMSAQMGSIPVGSLFRDDVQSLWTCEIDDVQRPGTYWSDDRCKEYIQSICSGLAPTPIVFVARDSSSPHRIIDGQHRVNAIRRFINGEILLPKGSNEHYSSVTLRPFPKWDEEAQRRFFNEKLIVSLFLPKAGTQLTDEQWWDEKTLLFKNLNSSRPVSSQDIMRLVCSCEDMPFNNAISDIIYYDSESEGYVFKPDRGSRSAFQTLTLCGYSYILGEVSELYPNGAKGLSRKQLIKCIELKKAILSLVGGEELKHRIENMHESLLVSRHTNISPCLAHLSAFQEINNAIIALSGLLGIKRVSVDAIYNALQNNYNELLNSRQCLYGRQDVFFMTEMYRQYISALKRTYDKNKKITASDMLTAATGLKIKV